MKHWEQRLATYLYNHYNICNIPIYFCNICMKHLQYTSKTSETLETYTCNMHFQHNISCYLGEWRVVDVWSSLEATVWRQRLHDAAGR
jgi:hypothetical protein